MLLIETQYFPPVQFFRLATKHDALVVEAKENYQKTGYRNRCIIAGPNGIQRLTVPLLKGKNEQQLITDTTIANETSWQKIHWQAIQTAYGKSPFFEFYGPELKSIFEKKWTYLFDLNYEIIQTLKELLQCSFSINKTSAYAKEPGPPIFDLRNKMAPKNREQPENLMVPYPQVFESKNGFLSNLSILDLLFCVGPESYYYLEEK
jgi:WbqC-like protein